MRSYRKLLQIEFFHNYYPSGQLSGKDFSIVPTALTRKIIDNYRLVLKQVGSTIEIIQECEKEEDSIEAVVIVDEELTFEFVISLANKNFFGFTDTKFLEMRKEVYYFTNKRKEKINQKGILTVNENVGAEDISDIEELNLPLGQSTSGIIGLLRLHIHDFVNDAIQTKEPFKYEVHFKEREAYWQFNVTEKYNTAKKLSILDEQKLVKFNQIKQASGDSNIQFVSDKKLPLQYSSNKVLKLISVGGKQGFTKTYYEKLPCPTIRDIAKHHELEGEYIAVANVYI